MLEERLSEKYSKYLEKGYLEAFLGMNTNSTWKARDLMGIAERAECHNTGWPIGVTLTKPELSPYPSEDGIEAIILGNYNEIFDYWSLKKNGDFYFIRTYQEDEEPTLTKSGKSVIWFDTQIWRISELILYCLNLGKELQVDFSKKVNIFIAYHGLENRVLNCNDPARLWFNDDLYLCRAKKYEFQFSESLDYIKVNYKDVVFNIASDFYYYFKFELNRGTCDSIVDKFLGSRI